MTVVNPEHLLEQAERLVTPPPAGPPRQADLRRAISAAYYSVFHFLLTAAADEFIGVTKRSSPHYELVYRSIGHRSMRGLCQEMANRTLSEKLRRFVPAGSPSADLQAFGAAIKELQEKRHSADYDPMLRVKTSDALTAIEAARNALSRFAAIADDERAAFIALLVFPPR